MRYSDTTPEGYRVERVVENVRVDCPTSLRLVDAATGKEGKPLAVTGTRELQEKRGGRRGVVGARRDARRGEEGGKEAPVPAEEVTARPSRIR